MEDRLMGSPFWQKHHTEGQLTNPRHQASSVLLCLLRLGGRRMPRGGKHVPRR